MPFLPMVLVAPVEPTMLVLPIAPGASSFHFGMFGVRLSWKDRGPLAPSLSVESRAPSSLRACHTPVSDISHLFPPLSSLFYSPLYSLIAHSISLSLAIVRSSFFVLSSFFLLAVVTALISSITFAD